MAETDDSFIARWSRRKRGKSPETGEGSPTPVAAETGESPETEPAQADIVDQLPDIDSLDENADFTVFLKKGVPEELRRRALRRLWRLNPVFANLDGLNDYDEDFTAAANILEGLKTAYKVGKGMPDPAEPGTGEQETGGTETSEAPAAEKSISADNKESPDERDESAARQIPEPGMTSRADQSGGRPQEQRDEVGSDDRRAAGPPRRSVRSAAVRRWGRLES